MPVLDLQDLEAANDRQGVRAGRNPTPSDFSIVACGGGGSQLSVATCD